MVEAAQKKLAKPADDEAQDEGELLEMLEGGEEEAGEDDPAEDD